MWLIVLSGRASTACDVNDAHLRTSSEDGALQAQYTAWQSSIPKQCSLLHSNLTATFKSRCAQSVPGQDFGGVLQT